MTTNLDKTFYLQLCDNPTRQPVFLRKNKVILSAINDEHLYLGMWFITSNNIIQHIRCNLSHRTFNIIKFYNWLEINEMTPINIKIQVLDTCMFAAYLYGCECWWCIDKLEEDIRATERKLLKAILKVKTNTPNDIIYAELDRCDVISKIKHRQKMFFKKCKALKQEEAVVKKILEMCISLDICKYYESIPDDLPKSSKSDMKARIRDSESTYNVRYNEISNCKYNDNIYNQFLSGNKRIIITKWRLSSHHLRIETGRYQTPKLPRINRTCSICSTKIEDEFHAIFVCPLYMNVRTKYRDLLLKILNPTSVGDAKMVGTGM